MCKSTQLLIRPLLPLTMCVQEQIKKRYVKTPGGGAISLDIIAQSQEHCEPLKREADSLYFIQLTDFFTMQHN